MIRLLTLLTLASLTTIACSSEKKVADKTTQPVETQPGVPMTKANDQATTIQGQIVFTNPTFDPSTGTQNVQLLRNGKVVSQASSNPDGTFEFKGMFENGDYQVKVNSKTLVGSAPLKITSNEVKDFVLPATLTAPKKK